MKSNWQKITVGDLCPFKYGKSLPKRIRDESGSFAVYGSGGYLGNHSKSLVQSEGIIIGRKGSVGEVYYSENSFWPIDTTFYVEPNSNSDIKYIYYFLQSLGLRGMNSDSAVPGLNRNHAHMLEVYVPYLKEQKIIGETLSYFDIKISILKKQNQTLEKMAQAIFKHWFVDFEFPNAEGKPYKTSGGKMVPSELGEIPEGWELSPIYDLASFHNGAAFRPNELNKDKMGMPVIKIAELKNGVSAQTYYSLKDVKREQQVCDGDILFSWSGSPETSIDVFLWSGGKGKLNQHTFKVLPNRRNSFEYVFFQLKQLKSQFIHWAKQKQTTGLGHVTVSDLKDNMVPLPSNQHLNDYTQLTSPILKKILLNLKQMGHLAALRDLLLPKLISGEIRIKEAS